MLFVHVAYGTGVLHPKIIRNFSQNPALSPCEGQIKRVTIGRHARSTA